MSMCEGGASVPERRPWEGRLYVVVDGSMPASTAAPQAMHALTEAVLTHPEAVAEWHASGNVCIVLEADGGEELARLRDWWLGRSVVSEFSEPDWAGSDPSAVVFFPAPGLPEFLAGFSTAKPRGWWGERKRRRALEARWVRPSGEEAQDVSSE